MTHYITGFRNGIYIGHIQQIFDMEAAETRKFRVHKNLVFLQLIHYSDIDIELTYTQFSYNVTRYTFEDLILTYMMYMQHHASVQVSRRL